jgi:uncharacterized protein (DUF1697 family)
MTAYVAMLRAVNVGGTAKLASASLNTLGEQCGFDDVRTFIASGNLLFTSRAGEAAVHKKVAGAVEAYFGKRVAVHVRSARDMAEAVAKNAFPERPGNRVIALFVEAPPAQAMIDAAIHVADEQMALGPRCLYIAYDEGMGSSKLRLPAMKDGTGRNMNSVAKMAALLAEME